MGKIADFIKNKVEQVKEDRERRQKIEKNINKLSRDAYNKAYKISRIAKASQEGREAGWKKRGSSGILGTLARYGESFSKAGEETFGLDSLNKLGKSYDSKKQKKDPFDLGLDELGFGQRQKRRKR